MIKRNKNLIAFLVCVVVGATIAYFVGAKDLRVGSFDDPFISIQLAPSPSAGYVLTTDGTENVWSVASAGTGDYPFTPTTAWGALAQSTTSLLAFPQGLISSSTIGRLTVGTLTATSTITGNLTGNVTGNLTGNADTSTKLATARAINGVNFDGTADITIASTTLLADSNLFLGTNWFGNTYLSSSSIGNLTLGTLTATSTATSTFAGGIQTARLNVTTASSTMNGLVITGGGLKVQTLFTSLSGSVVLSATTTMGTGTTTIKVSGFSQAWDFTELGCTSGGGGTFVAVIGTGSATSTAVKSATGNTTTFTTLSSNNSYTRGQAFFISFGSVSGAVARPSCSYTRLTK